MRTMARKIELLWVYKKAELTFIYILRSPPYTSIYNVSNKQCAKLTSLIY